MPCRAGASNWLIIAASHDSRTCDSRPVKNGATSRLAFLRKAILAFGGAAALALSIVHSPVLRAQSSVRKPLTFDVASVKPAAVPNGVILEDGKSMVHKGAGIRVPPNTGGPGTDNPGRIHYPLITLKQLLGRA